ncbi:MAG: serine hydrolase [Salinimicrobium sp.]
MRGFKNAIFGTLIFLALVVGLLYIFDYDYLFKGIKSMYLKGHTSAYIEDYKEFPNRRIEASAQPQPWPLHEDYNRVKATSRLQKENKKLGTVAFLIIKNDSIWYENYAPDYGKDSRTNSFSMAKSLVTAMLGKAIFEGKIESLNQPVADFFPQFDPELTLGDLASMASGLNWDESYYNPFSMTIRAYLDDDLREQILSLKVEERPGQEFKYLSGNIQLLGMVIEKATGRTLSDYLSESFWTPMGMREDALWQVDSEENGIEKAYCCIASNARDFSKFGKLYKDFGKWNGRQLIDSAFVAKSIHPRFENSPDYGYGIWLTSFGEKKVFYLRGILGQYVIVIPEDALIITRLGEEAGEIPEGEEHSKDLFIYIEEVYKMLQKNS